MISKWLPWKFLVRRAVKRYGFIDPFTLMARLRRFSQPSEVQEPIELIRAGISFHARGLLNTRAIQHNLDWVWPFWVERQFRADDPSFVPRAFSFSHVNLTHRNWTSVGQPDWPIYPIVDPRGLVTPWYDGCSLDFWVRSEDQILLPSKLREGEQELIVEPNLMVRTRSRAHDLELVQEVSMESVDDKPELCIRVTASGDDARLLVAALRPYNPEGIQLVESLRYDQGRQDLIVNSEQTVHFAQAPEGMRMTNYERGDILHHLQAEESDQSSITCEVGMATGAALFDISDGSRSIEVRVPLHQELDSTGRRAATSPSRSWSEVIGETARLSVPDEQIQSIYDAAARTVIQLSAGEIVPGPYTYRRFWFRDACLMMHAMQALGLTKRCRNALESFPGMQDHDGYFHSQEGEWDSNGQVLWIAARLRRMSDQPLSDDLLDALFKGAKWIRRKRRGSSGKPGFKGLLPPGFSAEHFGPNDFYYWDDFWAVAGLQDMAEVFDDAGRDEEAAFCREEAAAFWADIEASLEQIPAERCQGAWPAAPGRRLDAGAVGSLVADYPLQLVEPGHGPLGNTIDYLLQNCSHRGAFFQDMIHSGMNAYLTLAIAQYMLRTGNARYRQLIQAVADIASPTGQWPEAVHPHTLGGCMGDGQHGWAAAEWLLMIRHLFVREEQDELVLGSGLFPDWLHAEQPIRYGPTHTSWGQVTVSFEPDNDQLYLTLEADWHNEPPKLSVAVPDHQPQRLDGAVNRLAIKRT